MRNILFVILRILARLTLARYKPRVIGVTGNVGKTSAKDAIFAVVSSRFYARKSEKNYNNEIGVPLAILGINAHGANIIAWIISFFIVFIKLIYTRYPHILVLEMGVDKPGDMEYLLRIVKPDIVVFTSIGEIPVHIERFSSVEALIAEKCKLASAISKDGFIVMNSDCVAWERIRQQAPGRIVSFGFSPASDVMLDAFDRRYDRHEGARFPLGITFKIVYKGSTIPVWLDGTLSESGAYTAASACAVGIALGMNLVEISSALKKYIPPKGRMNIIRGVRGSLILDDTYNASPLSVLSALETLGGLEAERKIAVLGDMLELGTYTEEAHRAIGKKAAQACSVALCVGARMRFACDELAAKGFAQNERFFSFDTSEEAGVALESMVKAGDIVLVKGSQGMRMEKAVKSVMEQPERAKELLVRQDQRWLKT